MPSFSFIKKKNTPNMTPNFKDLFFVLAREGDSPSRIFIDYYNMLGDIINFSQNERNKTLKFRGGGLVKSFECIVY